MEMHKYLVSELDRKFDIEKKKVLLYIDTLKSIKNNPSIKDAEKEFNSFKIQAELYYDFHIKSRIM